MKKCTNPFMHLLVMLGLMLVLFLVGTLFVSLIFSWIDGYRTMILLTQAFIQIISMALPPILIVSFYYKQEAKSYLQLNFASDKWLIALACVVAMLLSMPIIDRLTVWNDQLHIGGILEDKLREMQEMSEKVMSDMIATESVGGLFGNLLVVALVPAVCEELFFRAGIQKLLCKSMPKLPHLAIWLTAAIFSLFHGEMFSFLPRFVMGGMLGYMFYYGGSILPNVVAHFINNAFVVVVYWLCGRGYIDIDPDAPLMVDWTITLCCTLASIVLLYVSFSKRYTNR